MCCWSTAARRTAPTSPLAASRAGTGWRRSAARALPRHPRPDRASDVHLRVVARRTALADLAARRRLRALQHPVRRGGRRFRPARRRAHPMAGRCRPARAAAAPSRPSRRRPASPRRGRRRHRPGRSSSDSAARAARGDVDVHARISRSGASAALHPARRATAVRVHAAAGPRNRAAAADARTSAVRPSGPVSTTAADRDDLGMYTTIRAVRPRAAAVTSVNAGPPASGDGGRSAQASSTTTTVASTASACATRSAQGSPENR